MNKPLPAAILFSGTGSNLTAIAQAIASGRLPVDLRLGLCDKSGAPGLERAREFAIPTVCLPVKNYASRYDHETAVMQAIDASGAQLIILAGYMRVLEGRFISHYPNRILNLHPSLLPAYPGLHTHERVLAAGDTWHGSSVHFVTETLDGGPLIAQAQVPVQKHDTPQTLAQRVLKAEHQLYPTVIGWYAKGWLRLHQDQVFLHDLPLANPVRFALTGTEEG